MPSKEDLLQSLSLKKLRELAKENKISLINPWSWGELTEKYDIIEVLASSKKITIKKINDKLSSPNKSKKTTSETPKPKRKTLAKASRTLILKSQNYKCDMCHKDISKISPDFDHRIPLAMSGQDEIENIQALCPNCHRIKTQRDRLAISRAKNK